MMRFAERTGLVSGRSPMRYLWTDAFAVCNFLGLARATGEARYTRARAPAGRPGARGARTVPGRRFAHRVAERARRGGGRGPIPRAAACASARSSPSAGPANRSTSGSSGTGTASTSTTSPSGCTPSIRCRARRGSRASTSGRGSWPRRPTAPSPTDASGPGGRRLVWKMSIDLSRPLVPSMGQHDPLDGLITCAQLQTTASMLPSDTARAGPRRGGRRLRDHDRGARLVDPGPARPRRSHDGRLSRRAADASRGLPDGELLDTLLAVALEGLPHYARQGDLRLPVSSRLAFRELGLAIGLRAIELVERDQALTRYSLARLGDRSPSGSIPSTRPPGSWAEHRDINEVMLATSLVPEGVPGRPTARLTLARGSHRAMRDGRDRCERDPRRPAGPVPGRDHDPHGVAARRHPRSRTSATTIGSRPSAPAASASCEVRGAGAAGRELRRRRSRTGW